MWYNVVIKMGKDLWSASVAYQVDYAAPRLCTGDCSPRTPSGERSGGLGA